jgi:hypothetical protein
MFFLAGFVVSVAWAGSVYHAGPATYLDTLKSLQPGDTLLLRPGIYENGLPVHRLNGTRDGPIVIAGADAGPAPTFLARPGHNTVSIVDSSYVTIRGLELGGGNLPVDGVKCEGHAGWAHHITVENLTITGHGNNQQTVGISTKCPAWNWVIRGNVIVGAGTGIYLGNSDGSAPFVQGVIEHNLVADTIGYNLQIKHQQGRPDLPGMPAGPVSTIIRHNVFSKASGGSTGPMARPNVLVGHWPLTGPGAEDVYLIYGNFFYQNPSEALFQGEGNVAVYNNIFVNGQGDAIRIQPHNDVPRVVAVFYNTVIASGTGISVIADAARPPDLQAVSGNAVFAGSPVEGGLQVANATQPVEDAFAYLANPLGPIGRMNLYPKPGKMKRCAFETRRISQFSNWDRDFSGRKRGAAFCGAYGSDDESPGWLPRLERKPEFRISRHKRENGRR